MTTEPRKKLELFLDEFDKIVSVKDQLIRLFVRNVPADQIDTQYISTAIFFYNCDIPADKKMPLNDKVIEALVNYSNTYAPLYAHFQPIKGRLLEEPSSRKRIIGTIKAIPSICSFTWTTRELREQTYRKLAEIL